MVVDENFFLVQSEFGVQRMTKKIFLIDHHYKTIYAPVRIGYQTYSRSYTISAPDHVISELLNYGSKISQQGGGGGGTNLEGRY